MNPEEFKAKTKQYALRIINLVRTLPNGREGDVFGRQLLRCGTSVAANYRAACRARSKAEFIAKLGIVEEEADESLFWMEILVDSGMIKKELLEKLMDEGNEILALAVASKKTARAAGSSCS